jgi:hypothetical protein
MLTTTPRPRAAPLERAGRPERPRRRRAAARPTAYYRPYPPLTQPKESPMIAFSEEALALAGERRRPVCIDAPYVTRGCCINMMECPSVRFGEPPDPEGYTRRHVQGVTLYIPAGLPKDIPLTIRARSVLGFKYLFLDGWKVV